MLKPGDVVGHIEDASVIGEFLGFEKSVFFKWAVILDRHENRFRISRWFPQNLYKIGVL